MDDRVEKVEIILYEADNGKSPLKDFLDSLDDRMIKQIDKIFSYLEDFGHTLTMPFSKHIEDGIYELRAKSSSGIIRVFYFFYIENTVVLTNGFIKKTQKTPRKEIETALKYREDYIEQCKKKSKAERDE